MAENPEDLIVTDAELRRQLPALADELGIGGGVAGSVPIFQTLAEAQAWEAKNPGKKAFYVADPVTGEDTSGVVPDSDTTGPTGATVAVSGVSASGYTVTVSGAVDVETGLHATAPYAFSKDGGATWTAWQASPSYSVTGLEASTTYPAPKVKVRNQSSTPDESVFTAPAGVTTKSGVTFQAAVADPPATFAWNMDEAAGTDLANTGADTANATAVVLGANATAGARAGVVGYSKAPDFTGLSVSAQSTIKTGAVFNDLTAVTAMAVVQIDNMTPYGAEAFSHGPITLRINSNRTLEGRISVGHYSPMVPLAPISAALASANADLIGKPLVLHFRYSANPDEAAVFFQGQKVGTDTYAAALVRASQTADKVPNMTYAEPASQTAVQKFAGALDGTMNSARIWLGTALSDAEILQHAQSAGVA